MVDRRSGRDRQRREPNQAFRLMLLTTVPMHRILVLTADVRLLIFSLFEQ